MLLLAGFRLFLVAKILEKMSQIRSSCLFIRRLKQRLVNPALFIQTTSFTTAEGHRPIIVHKRSLDILHDPWFNKVILIISLFFLKIISGFITFSDQFTSDQLIYFEFHSWNDFLFFFFHFICQGTAFSMTDRDRLDLRGLLPPNVMSREQQIARFSEFLLHSLYPFCTHIM